MQNDAHGFVEDGLQAVLGQGAALHVLALELFLNNLPGAFLQNGLLLGIFLQNLVFLPQVDLVSHKNFRYVSYVLSQLRIPLYGRDVTFLRALTKDEGSTTEKTIRKTSQLG